MYALFHAYFWKCLWWPCEFTQSQYLWMLFATLFSRQWRWEHFHHVGHRAKGFLCIISFNTHNIFMRYDIILIIISQMRKERRKEVKLLVQGHTSRKMVELIFKPMLASAWTQVLHQYGIVMNKTITPHVNFLIIFFFFLVCCFLVWM